MDFLIDLGYWYEYSEKIETLQNNSRISQFWWIQLSFSQ